MCLFGLNNVSISAEKAVQFAFASPSPVHLNFVTYSAYSSREKAARNSRASSGETVSLETALQVMGYLFVLVSMEEMSV